jgi:hypothetical protein
LRASRQTFSTRFLFVGDDPSKRVENV